MRTISINITGKVQGVFFRQQTRQEAQLLGITGYVKNLPDGSVYIIACGEDVPLNQLTEWCKHGPPKAIVKEVTVKDESLQSFEGFIILH